ncbi:MAG: sigma-70 family RNA polymerase sigma factor [Actinomycetota bacterium]|nr:sigma-70 family RNA polymerase sigma factor [Actinomycetota bacterium]
MTDPSQGSMGPAAGAERLVDEVPGLLRYARTLTRDQGQAEDLVQDTVVRALERFATFDARSTLATWLHRIMHNLAVDASRRKAELPTDMDDEGIEAVELMWSNDAYTIDSSVVVERADLRDQLRDALLRLPLTYRSAVVLHDGEGMRMIDVAEIQGIQLPAAKQRLRRGRMMLVSELDSGAAPEPTPEVPLRCWDARSRVSDYMDDDLAERDRALLEKHLETCPTCPPLYAGLVGVREAVGRDRDSDEAVPTDVAARIRALIEQSTGLPDR